MSEINREVLLEALSALIGVRVKPHTERRFNAFNAVAGGVGGGGGPVELTTRNYLHIVFGTVRSPLALFGDLAANSLNAAKETELFVDLEEFFDPQFDYDFRRGSDSTECSRGGEPYKRPWGWYRFALKILNKYPDGNTWLGPGGWRSESASGEWPVSFHGTSIEGAEGIAETHYKPGSGQVYGRGIYSTPDIHIAEQYVKKFTSKSGKTYEVIMQNRINPEKRKITAQKDYWLIPIPEGTSEAEEVRIVESSIRPYGILLKEV